MEKFSGLGKDKLAKGESGLDVKTINRALKELKKQYNVITKPLSSWWQSLSDEQKKKWKSKVDKMQKGLININAAELDIGQVVDTIDKHFEK